MDFVRRTVRLVNQVKAHCCFNSDGGDCQSCENCPKYEWKEVENHNLFMTIFVMRSIVNQNEEEVSNQGPAGCNGFDDAVMLLLTERMTGHCSIT